MNNWKKVKFKDFVYYQEGPGLMSYLFKENGFPFLNIRCIINGKIKRENCQFISEEIANNQYKHFQLNEDDLVVSTSGTLGKKAFINKYDLPLLLNTSIIRFKPKNENTLDRIFLNYILEDYKFLFDLTNQSTGSAQVNVGPSHLDKLWITIPLYKPEQTKIAQILSKADKAIEQTEALIAKYQRIKTGLMQDLLTKGIDENGTIRSKETHKFVNSNLKNYKVSIDWFYDRTLSDNTKVNQGLQIAIKDRHKEEGKNRHIYITIQYLNNHEKNKEFIYSPPKSVICKKDDILFTRTGNTGQIITNVEGVFHNNFFKVDYNSDDILKDYLVYYLNWLPIQNIIKDLSGTTTIPDMKHKDFYSIPIIYPKSLDEQRRIVKTLNSNQSLIESLINNLNKIKSLKTGLMQDLLSGKVRVKVKEEEKCQ